VNTALFFVTLALGAAAFVLVVLIVVGPHIGNRIEPKRRQDDPPTTGPKYDTLV
jgi:hypothetical protein